MRLVRKLALKIIAPLTDLEEHYEFVPWMVSIEPNAQNGLSKKSAIDLFQGRSLSQKRLSHKVGSVEESVLEACKRALNVVFD